MKRKRKYEEEVSSVDYINGIKGSDGEVAIRALNDDEKAWLKKFNSEYVGGNFDKTNNLHDPLFEQNKKNVESIKNQIKVAKKQLKDHSASFKLTYGKDQKDSHATKKIALKELIDMLKEELASYDIKGNIWKDRYSKRMDMYHNDVVSVCDLFVDQENKSETELFDAILANSNS